MAVVIETTLGDITVDLYLEQRPVTCLNFLKLCKMKYYNFNLFHSIRSGFIAQTGDPTGEGDGGQSIWGILEGPQKRFFSGEKMPKIRHTEVGLLSMVCTNDMMVGSQFFFTLAPDLDSLDGTHCVIGEVTEGHEVLTKLNEVICDESHRPYRDVRITHTVVLEDPFNDPPGLRAPSRSPSPSAERLKGGRIAPDEDIDETEGKTAEEIQEMIEEKEAKARATILEIVGDLPDADIAPPENVLFVCKLNPVTTDDDLEIIFSRFGKIVNCEVIRDKKTGNSLQYAFIEFDNKKSCEDAYFKMDNVLIDDRRIHVDFSQSVSKMRYLGKGRGIQYLNDDNSVIGDSKKEMPIRHSSSDRDRKRSRDRYRKDEDRHYDRNESRYKDDRHRNYKYDSNRYRRDRSRSHTRNGESISRKERESRRENYSRDHNNSHRHRNDHNDPDRSHKTNSSHKSNDRRDKHSPSNSRRKSEVEYRKGKTEKPEDEYRKRNKSNGKKHMSPDDSVKARHKSKKCDDPTTPSPVRDIKIKSKDKLKDKKVKDNKPKKKRKVSTSSSDSSSDSSSSSESSSSSTSSSESDRKKKKIKQRKRKHSTSSSSSSSSSTESSSESSSSNSGSDKKMRKKKERKTPLKKSKK